MDIAMDIAMVTVMEVWLVNATVILMVQTMASKMDLTMAVMRERPMAAWTVPKMDDGLVLCLEW